MHPSQAPVGEPALDPVRVDSRAKQLLAGDQAMLGVGDAGDDVSEWAYIAL